MYIGLYTFPTNSSLSFYKGLYRQNELIEFYEGDDIRLSEAIHSFFLLSREGVFAGYSRDNLKLIETIYYMLSAYGWCGDILLFSDDRNVVIPDDFCFLGYDICADSMYYSPIGDGKLHSYNANDVFFSKMTFMDFQTYQGMINQYGLFSSYLGALAFSEYCNFIGQQYEHAVETEEHWRPFAVYHEIQDGGTVCVNPSEKLQ